MQFVGMSNGQAKAFDSSELAAHIIARSGNRVSQANANHCANAILAHPGGDNAGGAIPGIHYHGHAIYHETRNFGAVGQRCTVFFADAGGGIVKLLAVAEHIGGGVGVGHPVYTLDWVAKNWGGSAHWQAGQTLVL
jgi:hypothetical protein